MPTILEITKLPSSLVLDPPLTDEEFETLCLRNNQARLERTKEGGRIQGPSATFFRLGLPRSCKINAVEKMENKGRFPLSHGTATAISLNLKTKLVALGV